MLDKVLKAWECCDSFNRRCFECPYEDDCFHDNFDRVAIADMVKLLKEQQPKWIPINERLPEEKETVLLTDGYDVSFGYITTNRKFIFVDEGLSKDDLPIKSKNCWGISHWMPLPKIPKDGDGE